jgi:hypothetical protein
MRRRALLASIAAATALSGCSDTLGGGTPEPTPEQDTLASADGTTTVTATDGAGSPAADTPTSTATGTADPTGTPTGVRFDAQVDDITNCGLTCRTLTYTLQNRGTATAESVAVGIRVLTDGEQVYEGSQAVGDLDPRSQRTGISTDIDVGLGGGRKISSNDGWVVAELTPRTAGGAAATFRFERQLDV